PSSSIKSSTISCSLRAGSRTTITWSTPPVEVTIKSCRVCCSNAMSLLLYDALKRFTPAARAGDCPVRRLDGLGEQMLAEIGGQRVADCDMLRDDHHLVTMLAQVVDLDLVAVTAEAVNPLAVHFHRDFFLADVNHEVHQIVPQFRPNHNFALVFQ